MPPALLRAPNGETADERIKGNYAADEFERAYDVDEDSGLAEGEVHGLSKKYTSAYSIGGDVCLNQRLGY